MAEKKAYSQRMSCITNQNDPTALVDPRAERIVGDVLRDECLRHETHQLLRTGNIDEVKVEAQAVFSLLGPETVRVHQSYVKRLSVLPCF
jgi:hypothetical protein